MVKGALDGSFKCRIHLKNILHVWGKKGTETPVNWQLMETVASQGRVLTLAPFCKSFAPEANNCGGGGYVSVCECVWRTFVCRSGKSCCGSVVQSFNMAWSCFILPVCWEVKAPDARQRPRTHTSVFPEPRRLSGIGRRWGNCINKSILPDGRADFIACSAFCKPAFWWQFPVSSCSQSIHTERTP